MNTAQKLIIFKHAIKRKEKELNNLKSVYDIFYEKVIDKIAKEGEKYIEARGHKIFLTVRKNLDIKNWRDTYRYMFNNHQDKMALDRNKIKELLKGGEKVEGSELVEGFYLKIIKKN